MTEYPFHHAESGPLIDPVEPSHVGSDAPTPQPRPGADELRAILDNIPAFVALFSPDGTVLEANQHTLEQWGLTRDEFVGRRPWETRRWEGRPDVAKSLQDTFEKAARGHSVRSEIAAELTGGRRIITESTLRPIVDSSGEVTMLLSFAVDVTEGKRARRALLESDARLREAQQLARLGSWDLNLADNGLVWSDEIYRIFEIDPERFEASYEAFLQAVHPEDREKVDRAYRASVEARLPYLIEHRLLMPDGRVKHVEERGRTYYDAAGQPTRSVGTVQDITEQRRAEEALQAVQQQLVSAQRLEGIGRLAGGIAHDFNNLLTAILGYSQLVANQLEAGSSLSRDMDEVIAAAERAATLTRQLLTFARRQPVEPRAVDLNATIRAMEQMLRRLISEDVAVVTGYAEESPVAVIDPGQLEQVVVNLAVNARDAMPRGGRLTINTRNVHLDETYAASNEEINPGPYALIEVTDTGIGMPADVIDRIFEPFFTTKDIGVGTGLGLAICYGIVKQARGHITVYSDPGIGTTFRVYLPAASFAEDQSPGALPSLRPVENDETVPGIVLLVEDQEQVRSFAERVLLARGYGVVAASEPIQALELAARAPRIDLIVSDVIMPLMDGVTMVEILSSMIGPRPTVLMSGYAEDTVISRVLGNPDIHFLAKPLTAQALLMAASAALRRPVERIRHGEAGE